MNTELSHHLAQLRSRCLGFNSRAESNALQALIRELGDLPDEVLQLYGDHDGSDSIPKCAGEWMPGRLLPVREAIETNAGCSDVVDFMPKPGKVALLWTDDNSNYMGVYTSGLLSGWLTVLDHDNPALVPAYRSVASLYARLATDHVAATATDIPLMPRDLPAVRDDSTHLAKDRELAAVFFNLYRDEADEDMRRIYAMTSICLTPVCDTQSVVAFFSDDDMWTPEAAVGLMEFRRYHRAVNELERLVINGRTNGDSAAMCLLARMNTDESRHALARLRIPTARQT
jgi:hypothetical protein